MSGVAYYSRNVFDDIKFRSKMPVVAEAADVVATRLRPAMGHPGCPAPTAQGRFFSLNRTGPGVRRCVLRCPYESLKHVATTAKGYAEVTKVEYFNNHGLCDIHLNYVVSALEPMRRAVDEACNGAAKFLSAEESESTPEHQVKAMLENRADGRALCKAARKGDLNEVKRRVLRDKVDPSTKQRDGTTPLHHAAAVVHVDVVEWLVSQGANPAAKDARGRTPADAARAGGAANPAHPRHPRYHLTLKSLEGKSLFRASKDGDLVRMQYLLESGASPNEANPRGVTPLHLAVSHEQLDAITLLLDHGADPRTKNSVGKSALDVAADHGKLGRRTLTLLRRQVQHLDRTKAQEKQAKASAAQDRMLEAFAHEARVRTAAELRQVTRGTTAAKRLRLAEQQVQGKRRRPPVQHRLAGMGAEVDFVQSGIMGPPRLARPGSRPSRHWDKALRGDVPAVDEAAATMAESAGAVSPLRGGRGFMRGSGSGPAAELATSIRAVEMARDRVADYQRLRSEQEQPRLALPSDSGADEEGGPAMSLLEGVSRDELTSTALMVSDRLGITVDGLPRREAEARWGAAALPPPPRGGAASSWELPHSRDPSLRSLQRGSASHSVSRLTLTGQLPAASEVAAAWDRRAREQRRWEARTGRRHRAISPPGVVSSLLDTAHHVAATQTAAGDPTRAGPVGAAAGEQPSARPLPEFDPENASSPYLGASPRRQQPDAGVAASRSAGSSLGRQALSTHRSVPSARLPPYGQRKRAAGGAAAKHTGTPPPASGAAASDEAHASRGDTFFNSLASSVRLPDQNTQGRPSSTAHRPKPSSSSFDDWYRSFTGE